MVLSRRSHLFTPAEGTVSMAGSTTGGPITAEQDGLSPVGSGTEGLHKDTRPLAGPHLHVPEGCTFNVRSLHLYQFTKCYRIEIS